MRTSLALITLALVTLAVPACSRKDAPFDMKPGRDVTLQTTDGVTVAGRLVEVRPEHVIVEQPDGATRSVARRNIASVSAAPARAAAPAAANRAEAENDGPAASARAGETDVRQRAGEPDNDARRATGLASPSGAAAPPVRRTEHRSVTVPPGTLLPLELATEIGSDTSRVEDPVRATLRRGLVVDGVQVLPAGTRVLGTVTSVERAGRVKGRARIAFRFTSIEAPDEERVRIRTEPVARVAAATKKKDAAKIGGAAAGGAIIGGILGGGDGAAKGAAIGGAAGTGVVLSTRGDDVRLGVGAPVAARLAAPVTLRVPLDN